MIDNENDIKWYVFSVSYQKETEICSELQDLGLTAYVPMHYRLITLNGKKIRKREPAVFGLVFAKGSRKQLLDYRGKSKLKPYMFLKSHRMMDGTLQYVVIRDNDMDNFQRLNSIKDVRLTYYKPDELRLEKGQEIKIMDGPFEGITGVVQKLPHKRGQFLVVSLPDVAIAAVSIRPDFIKPISHKVAKSTNVEKDSKRLATIALEMIMDEKARGKSYLQDEMLQLEESLKGCKTYLPNDKANYYFALYTASLVKRQPSKEYKEELEKVLPKLKSNNLLLPSASLMFFYETKDEAEWQKAEKIISKWDSYKYTEAQRGILRLRQFLAHQRVNAANNK